MAERLTAATAPGPGPGTTPTVFGVKIVAMYLAEDVDPVSMDNVGNVQRIWTNPACDSDGRRCSIAPSSGPYQVKDYFDLALPSAVVNANLSSQGATVDPGNYRYLRFDMAGVLPPGENSAPNLRFGASAADASEVRFRSNNYTILIDPPLELAAGDSVTVTLAYDVTDAYYTDPGLTAGDPPVGYDVASWYCAGGAHDPAGPPCLAFRGFEPSVGKVAARAVDAGH